MVLSEIIDKDKKIYTFEPQYYDCLVKNIKDNNLENVIIPYKYGLSNLNGFIPENNIDFNIKANYGGRFLTTLYDKQLDDILIPKGPNTIELKKLDDFEFNEIGLIKLDVEGFELLVLQGGVETIKRNNYPPIFIEIWDAVGWKNQKHNRNYYIKNKNDIMAFLGKLHYKIVWKNKHDYVFIHFENY